MTEYLSGKVQSGVGRGATFIAIPVYCNIFEKHLNKEPYYGTLNLKLDESTSEMVNKEFGNGVVYDELEYEGKSLGGIVIIPIKVKVNGEDIDAVAVRPHLTSHDSDIIEIVTFRYLRSYLSLDDGDTLKFRLI